MTREEAIKRVKGYLTDYFPADCYGEVEEIIKALEQNRQDAKSEIMRCKNCKHHHYEYKLDGLPYCDKFDYGYGWSDDDFCSKWKEKNDES